MAELRGKGWRVVGYFIWMLGAGLALDGDGGGAGPLLLGGGAGLFALGVWHGRAARQGGVA